MLTAIIILVLAGVILLGSLGVTFYTDLLWFQHLELESVFFTVLGTQVALFLLPAVLFFGLALASAGIAVVLARRLPRLLSLDDFEPPQWVAELQAVTNRFLQLSFLGIALFLSVLMGSSGASNWEMVLRYLNQTAFGRSDPLFGLDISFFVFGLPFYRFLLDWATTAMVLLLLLTAAVYVAYIVRTLRFSLGRFTLPMTRGIKAHLSILGAIVVFLFAISYRLDLYELVFSTGGAVFGATYTDVNARYPALNLLFVVALATAVLLLAGILWRGVLLPAIGAGAWIAVAVLAAGGYPGFVQEFQVRPNELARERPYIGNNIAYTRQAYGLERIQELPLDVQDAPTPADILANPQTINNIRVWDHRPLLETYDQIQAIRLYYDFNDVDIDRYRIDGDYRQVMLSARELNYTRLPKEAQGWINQRLQFTHGYGVAVSPVNEISAEGLPNLWVKDVPPVGKIPIQRPELYFNETANDYVIVRTAEPEFDYPKGDENVRVIYEGKGGVPMSSFVQRLAFAMRFGDINIVLPTSPLTSESRIMIYRKVQERINRLAPFLLLDRDPYIVIADGRLVWLQDAYTISNRYPYSTPFNRNINYIRNSVKIAVDAYDGTTTFYVFEPDDPIVQAYQRIFPTLFTPASAMPASLRDHVRYPEDMFRIQAEIYRTYHMVDPVAFYNREDMWVIPNEIFEDRQVQMDPYYVIMRLPGEDRDEFVLILPFTPTGKNNMIGWMAARSDQPNYGSLFVYNFPKDRLVYGPMQIEARVDQDPFISQQFTLWNQSGSRVLRGNLLVIPIANALLYVEPIYLRAERTALPELKKVILARGTTIAMESTLGASLATLFGRDVVAAIGLPVDGIAQPPTVTSPTAPTAPTTIVDLARSANDRFRKAQERLKAGDWAGFGDELKGLETDLRRLQELATPPVPTPVAR